MKKDIISMVIALACVMPFAGCVVATPEVGVGVAVVEPEPVWVGPGFYGGIYYPFYWGRGYWGGPGWRARHGGYHHGGFRGRRH